jgi:CYTH domain-containing protein
MGKEVERKFLVSGAEWRNLVEADIRIRQFYLAAAPGRTVRVRISDHASARLTLKFGGEARERNEFEYPVPLAEAEEMLAFAIGRVIEKTRHHVRHRGYLYEVDVFGGMLAGLVVAELETPDDVPDEMLPDWLGREVTGEQKFYNASLALGGIPEIAA